MADILPFKLDAYHIYSDGSSDYRLVFADNPPPHDIKYIHISADALPSKTLINFACHPRVLQTALPPFPSGLWNQATIVRCPTTNTAVFGTTSLDPLPSLHETWHTTTVRHTDLTFLKRLRPHVRIVSCPQFRGKVVYKFAALPKDLGRIAAETRVYQRVNEKNRSDRFRPPWAPRFLAHVEENGSITGFLMEYVRGRVPRSGGGGGVEDLETCLRPLMRLHGEAEYLLGQIRKESFLIRKMRPSGGEEVEVGIVLDFQHAVDLQGSEWKLRKKKEKDDLKRLLERGIDVLKEENGLAGGNEWKP